MRKLAIVTPYAHGPDVRKLQEALNAVEDAHPRLDRVEEDGEYGPETDHRVRQIAFLLGIGKEHIHGPVMPDVQRLILSPGKRTDGQKRSSRARFKAWRKTLHGADATVQWCREQVGVKESPAGSNRGPLVSKWQKDVAGIDGQPWCGAFVGYGLKHVGGIVVAASVVYTPSIYTHGLNGTGGMERVVKWDQRQPGDLLLYKWPGVSRDFCDHVGILDTDRVHSVEGNTSPGVAGSQSNGGGVYRRDRGNSNVVAVVRPRWR